MGSYIGWVPVLAPSTFFGGPDWPQMSFFGCPPQGERQCAGHLFGPLLIRSPNPCFLHGPFPVGNMDWPLSSWGYVLAPFRLRIPTRRNR